ncbi:nucleotidyl transferase AbiEii/AbiGii toxin family protein [Chitinophaga agrisoli]|uniref:Nucleotidyl transferase AbiEii/AbiGii toxin family protein n=1 Tax=Chitinophaga agrisoli TaxID=2607653 RepID=A0A5B2VLQ7_9BACT|nr:nucleotidyl transferase AbiEii/AbiGii toxin family protein [Chitinophaga agrisoli]KAA2239426.1 nucleotidyl transferase AbiEii/AbiGii toxin family protein [Chitinophaga agrisoli]
MNKDEMEALRPLLLAELREENRERMLVNEAFIRRAVALQQPFMLKGSFVTRQYFANPEDRFPYDLDWVYTGGRIDDVEKATEIFSRWIETIAGLVVPGTENIALQLDFQDKKMIWEAVDYSMSWDKPTISTSYYGLMGGKKIYMGEVDISYNVPVEMNPVPITYQPLTGDPFIVSHAVPLPLQISWKLHQTIVRPRFKDMFDLIHLLQHPSYTRDMAPTILKAMVKECAEGKVAQHQVNKLLTGDLVPLFNDGDIFGLWQFFRFGYVHEDWQKKPSLTWLAAELTNPDNLPATFKELREALFEAMQRAGITIETLHSIPYVERKLP